MRNLNKRIALFALSALLLLSLASCGEDSMQNNTTTGTEPGQTTPENGIYVTPTPVFPMTEDGTANEPLPDQSPAPIPTPAPGTAPAPDMTQTPAEQNTLPGMDDGTQTVVPPVDEMFP